MIFYVLFMLIGSLLILNLFVGVVVRTFKSEKEKSTQNFLLMPNQREWIRTQLLALRARPKSVNIHKSSRARQLVRRFIDHTGFSIFINGCILTNTAVLGLKWYNEPETL